MFEIYKFSEHEMSLFILTLLRISSCLVVMPIIGSKNVPKTVKVLLSLVITLCLFSVLKDQAVGKLSFGGEFILLGLREVFVGVFFGFLVRMFFFAVDVAGQVLSFSLALNHASLVNPTSGSRSSPVEQFQNILAVLLFLAINGHLLFLQGLYDTFQTAQLGVMSFNIQTIMEMNAMVTDVFLIGIRLAGPMMAVTIILNMAQGVIGRVVPQINVFVTSLQVNILVGLFIFLVSIPVIFHVLENEYEEMGARIFKMVRDF